MKSYTDLEQSKKLAEILPIESADFQSKTIESNADLDVDDVSYVIHPCWSLAALFNVLPRIGGIKPVLDLETNCIQYPSDIDLSITADNSVDACYEMILQLHKLKML